MLRKPTSFVPLLVAARAAVSIAAAPIAAADGSASATIADLQAQGYDVQINWVRGTNRVPLYYCTVTGINNPNRTGNPPDPLTLTTVYVDVLCPDDEWGGGFGFGAGF
jgi:hypothetical protein